MTVAGRRNLSRLQSPTHIGSFSLRALSITLLLAGAGAAQAASPSSSSQFCDGQAELGAAAQDRLIRFGAVVKNELERSGQRLALIARSGLDLERFGQRYSHAGLSLKASQNTPWSVRQLYYACDEGRPRIFDQGMSGFVLGTSDPSIGYVSIVLLPEEAAAVLERTALDDRQALQLLGASYSANAYPFSLRYQNCNQWLAELMALAWGRPAGAAAPRAEAQQWLRQAGYTPTAIEVGWRPLMWLAAFIPWLHSDDHPAEDLAARRYRVSMPASLEGFVRDTLPGARRIELCHTEHQIVIRRGWEPLAEGCRAAAQDEVIALD